MTFKIIIFTLRFWVELPQILGLGFSVRFVTNLSETRDGTYNRIGDGKRRTIPVPTNHSCPDSI